MGAGSHSVGTRARIDHVIGSIANKFETARKAATIELGLCLRFFCRIFNLLRKHLRLDRGRSPECLEPPRLWLKDAQRNHAYYYGSDGAQAPGEKFPAQSRPRRPNLRSYPVVEQITKLRLAKYVTR